MNLKVLDYTRGALVPVGGAYVRIRTFRPTRGRRGRLMLEQIELLPDGRRAPVHRCIEFELEGAERFVSAVIEATDQARRS